MHTQNVYDIQGYIQLNFLLFGKEEQNSSINNTCIEEKKWKWKMKEHLWFK